MMIGEFETDPLLYSVPSILLFPFTTFGLWIIFVLVMSILLQNLLVWRMLRTREGWGGGGAASMRLQWAW